MFGGDSEGQQTFLVPELRIAVAQLPRGAVKYRQIQGHLTVFVMACASEKLLCY